MTTPFTDLTLAPSLQGAKGELTEPLVKEVGAFDKYVAIAQPFDLGLSKAAAAAAAASGTRKMLSFDTLVMPNHGRQLLGKEEQGCGWAYAFHWWTVALQGISVIGILLLAFTSSEGIAKLRPTFFAFLAINTALLCGIASQLIPVTFVSHTPAPHPCLRRPCRPPTPAAHLLAVVAAQHLNKPLMCK